MRDDMNLGKTKIRPNGEPGILEIEWSPLIRWGAGVIAALVVTAIAGNIAMYREVGAIREAQLAAQREFAVRAMEAFEMHRQFITRPEFEAHSHGGSASRERP